MEIIFHRYGSICEPDIIDAFQALGITVIEDDTEVYQKSIAPADRIRLISEQILAHQAAFVFTINYFPYISQICERLKILYVCLSVDCPVLELFSDTIHNKCNRIFLFDYNQYLQFKDENPDCIFYLPLATNVNRWDNLLSGNEAPSPIAASYDVSFVGSLYTEKSPYLALPLSAFDRGFCDGLIEAQLKLPGLGLIEEALTSELISSIKASDPSFHTLPDSFTDTDAYVASNYYLGMQASSLERIRILNTLSENFQVDLFTRSDTSAVTNVRCHNGVSTHREMPLVFNRSKINLNITIHSIQSGLSQRIWDVMGCGGFLLTNYQEELPEYFEIGKDLECYENISDCIQKIQYYLIHDDIRREIAANGYKKVKAMHTYTIRIAQILKSLYPEL